MTQKVLKVGGSAAVTIPKRSLEELGLKPGDQVRVEIDHKRKSVTIIPHKPKNRIESRIAKLTYNFIQRYRKDLEALAQK